MGRIRFTLSNIIFYVIIVAGCFFLENIALLTTDRFLGFDNFTFFTFLILCLFLISFYLVVELKNNKIRTNWFALPTFSVLFIILSIMIFTFQGEIVNEKEIAFSLLDKWKLCFQVGVGFILLYLCLSFFAFKIIRPRMLCLFLYIYVATCIISIILSFFIDFECYKIIFLDGDNIRGVHSFYFNENTYGMSLLLGILSLFALNVYKKRWWNYLLIFVFFIFQIFSTCVTSLLVSCFAIISYGLFQVFYRIHKHWKLSLFTLCISFLFLIGLIITYCFLYSHEVKWLLNLNEFIKSSIFNKQISTVSGRTYIWKCAFNLLKESPAYILFGRGPGVATLLLRNSLVGPSSPLPKLTSAHNAFIEVFLQSGLLGLFVYIAFLIALFVLLIKLMIKKQFEFSFVYFICVFSIILTGISESYIIFSPKTLGMYTGIVFTLPIICNYRSIKEPTLKKDFILLDVWKNKIATDKLARGITSFILPFVLCLASLFLCPFTYEHPFFLKVVLLFLILGIITLIFIPNLISTFIRNSSRKRFLIRILIHGTFIFSTLFALLITSYFVKPLKDNALWVIPLYFFLLLFLYNFIFTILNGEFKAWLINLIKGIFIDPKFAYIGFILSTLFFFLIVPTFYTFNYLSIVLSGIFIIIIYFVLMYGLASKNNKYLIAYFNEECLARQKYYILKYKY